MKPIKYPMMLGALLLVGCSWIPHAQPPQPPCCPLPSEAQQKSAMVTELADKYYRYHVAGSDGKLYAIDLAENATYILKPLANDKYRWERVAGVPGDDK